MWLQCAVHAYGTQCAAQRAQHACARILVSCTLLTQSLCCALLPPPPHTHSHHCSNPSLLCNHQLWLLSLVCNVHPASRPLTLGATPLPRGLQPRPPAAAAARGSTTSAAPAVGLQQQELVLQYPEDPALGPPVLGHQAPAVSPEVAAAVAAAAAARGAAYPPGYRAVKVSWSSRVAGDVAEEQEVQRLQQTAVGAIGFVERVATDMADGAPALVRRGASWGCGWLSLGVQQDVGMVLRVWGLGLGASCLVSCQPHNAVTRSSDMERCRAQQHHVGYLPSCVPHFLFPLMANTVKRWCRAPSVGHCVLCMLRCGVSPSHPHPCASIHLMPCGPMQVRTLAYCGEGGCVSYSLIGPGSHACQRIGRPHRSNHVFYVVDFESGHFCQKCHDPECAAWRSPWRPLPPEVWRQQGEGGGGGDQGQQAGGPGAEGAGRL
jgi:hypothetical protein